MPNLTYNSVQALIAEQTETLMEQIAALRAEVAQLQASLAAAREEEQTQPENPALYSSKVKELEKTVAASVKTALRENKSKCEVITEKLPEEKRDSEDVETICSQLHVSSRPTCVTRLGKTESERPRPTKITFSSQFDARLFL
jgi:chromosome segregation ATPase